MECYRLSTNNSPMAVPLMSNASSATTGTGPGRPPPVLGSSLPSGTVSRITPSLCEVVSEGVLLPVVADPVVLAPAVSLVLAPVVSPVVVPVDVPVVPVVVPVVSAVPVVVPVVLVPVVVPVVPVVLPVVVPIVPVVLVPVVVPVVLVPVVVPVVLVPVVVPVVPVVVSARGPRALSQFPLVLSSRCMVSTLSLIHI